LTGNENPDELFQKIGDVSGMEFKKDFSNMDIDFNDIEGMKQTL
jgi:hypothetical protein